MAERTRRQLFNERRSALIQERESWVGHWREISGHLLPRNGRFLVSDRNRGDKRHNTIYDSTGTKALRILSAGLMAGMTSPARPWFRLATPDPDLMEFAPVKQWMHQVTVLMRDVFAKSNTYRSLHTLYEELAAFGTVADIVLPDFQNVIHHHPLTIGEYAIATDYKGDVTTLYREFDMTVSQVVGQFVRQADGNMDWSVASGHVKSLWDSGALDKWITVCHVIEPRSDRDVRMRDAKNLPWGSCYYELAGEQDTVLRESGFRRFPAVCPRWAVSGGDIYGHSPGMESLGDIKQLQHEQYRKAQGIDYLTKPPLQGPSSLKEQDVNMLPGGLSFHEMTGPASSIKPLWEPRLDLNHLLLDIQDVRERIRSTFYADLFMMIAQDQRSNITAREIAERHEEKLLMLGPVLERLHNEILSPLIDLAFDTMLAAGIVPPPPEELHGMDLNVQFISVLAQAQRAVGVQSVDRLLGTIGSMAQFKPDVLDKLDADQVVDAYSEMLGVDPNLIVADDKVAIVRADRAKQQQAMQQAEALRAGAQTARDLSQADTGGQNALTDIMNQFSGYSIPA